MTEQGTALRELLAKRTAASFLREMIGFAAERLMDLEVGGMTGAAHGERSPDRLVQRNGYRQRDRKTRAGTVELRIPKLRRGSHFPCFLEPRRTAERALVAVIQEAYVHGVSRGSLLASFGKRLSADLAAVRAALTETWSNGQTEGQITKLKLLKRQM
jgi:transposase-like protein